MIINPFLTALKVLYFIFFGPYWWVYMPVVGFFILFYVWVKYIRLRYIANIKWVLLEIKIPANLIKSPKSMEQIFIGLHGIQSGGDIIDKYWKGKIQDWFSFEIVGRGGFIHFFVRTPIQYRNLVEAQIFAQYSEAEIIDANDYVSSVPEPPHPEWDLWGTEFILIKDDIYPIKTYRQFEASKPELAVDPIASFLEVMSKLSVNEQIWLQILIRPVPDKWKEAGKVFVENMMGRSNWAPGKPPKVLSPGEREILEAIEQNISKLGFEVCIRFIYTAKKDNFNKTNIAAIIGCFKQFGLINLNGFKPNKHISPSIKYLFKNYRNTKRKIRLYKDYAERFFALKSTRIYEIYVLSTEELATIYHLPTIVVEAPTLARIQAKKGEPPSGLPI